MYSTAYAGLQKKENECDGYHTLMAPQDYEIFFPTIRDTSIQQNQNKVVEI